MTGCGRFPDAGPIEGDYGDLVSWQLAAQGALIESLRHQPACAIVAMGRAYPEDSDRAHRRSVVNRKKCVAQEMQGS
jgi:hypothetical protein